MAQLISHREEPVTGPQTPQMMNVMFVRIDVSSDGSQPGSSRMMNMATASGSPRGRLVAAGSLREHILDLLVAQPYLVDRLSALLQRDVIAIDVGRQKDL